MQIETRCEKNTLIVKVIGELDLVVAEKFKNTTEQELLQPKMQNLILDLKDVNFIDSSGLGAILGRYKTVLHKKGKMAIVYPQPAVKRILELAGLLRIITIYHDLPSALAVM